jgi:hypothetical protein
MVLWYEKAQGYGSSAWADVASSESIDAVFRLTVGVDQE